MQTDLKEIEELLAQADRYHERGQFAAAGGCLEEALKLRPDNVAILVAYGYAQFQSGHLGGASGAFLRAIHIDPRYVAAHVNLALTYQRLDRLQEALESARRALELVPGDLELLKLLSRLAYDAGDYASAGKAWYRLAKEEPGNAEHLVGLGCALHRAGETGTSREAFELALQLDPNNKDARANLEALVEANGSKASPGQRSPVQQQGSLRSAA